MAKIRTIIYTKDTTQYLYNCPGCRYEHAFKIHKFNGDINKPTISPSLLNNFSPDRICHSYITDGRIKFLDDCWHPLKGQEVDLPDYAEGTELVIDYSKR